MSSQSILIIGASGYLGPHIVREFLAHKSQFARVAILAEPSKVGKFAAAAKDGMEIVVGSFLDVKSFVGFTTVISLLGNHAMALQPALITVAVTAGVTHIYPSEFGSDLSQPIALTTRYFRDKQLTRRHLELVAELKKNEGFGYTYIMSGGFAEFAAHPAFGFDPERARLEFWGNPKKREPFTGVGDVAKYTVASVLTLPHPGTVSASPARSFKIPTTTHSWEEIVDIISSIEGKKYSITVHPNSEAYALVAKYAKDGNVDQELAYSLKAFLGDPNSSGVPKPWDHDKLPDIKPESVEVCLRRYLESQK